MKTSPVIGSVQEQMVGGTLSPTSQDSVVMLVMPDGYCSATLIAPDLLITAHHCVAVESSDDDDDDGTHAAHTADSNIDASDQACGALGALRPVTDFQVKLNAPGGGTVTDPSQSATLNGPTVATATQVWTQTTNNICSYDVALIKLNKPIPNAKTSNLRFSALAANEAVTAVGYGDDGAGDYPNSREMRATNVLGVGPTTVQYQSQTDGTIPLILPTGDVMTGESHCFGDSGGPLLDKDGNIVAIISRGPDNAPTSAKHFGAENCIDMAEVYAGAAFNADFIRQAAKDAGHALTSGDIGSTTGSTSSSTQSTSSGSSSTSGDDDDDSSSSKKSSSSTSSGTSAADTIPSSSSCSAVPGGAGGSRGSGGLLLLGLAVALASSRRRRVSV